MSGNVRKLYLFRFCNSFLALMPVIVPFFVDLGFSMQEIFELQAVFAMVVVIFEVPSGYLADIFGRKLACIVGALLAALAFTSMPFLGGYWEFVVFEFALGLGFSLRSGADFSLLYDSVEGRSELERANVVSYFYAIFSVSEAIAALAGGYAATYSYTATIVVTTIPCWIAFVTILTVKEPPIERMSREDHWQNLREVFVQIFRENRLTSLTFVNFVVWSNLTYVMAWCFQRYWLEVGIDIVHFGYLWAAYNLVVAIAARYASQVESRLGTEATLLLIPALGIVGLSGMIIGWGWTGVFIGVSLNFGRGFVAVILQNALHRRLPAKYRATINSIGSLGIRLCYSLLGPALGFVIDGFGMKTGLIAIIGYWVVICVPMFLLIRQLRSAS